MTWARVQTFSQNAQYSAGGAASTAAALGSAVAIGDTILVYTTVGISGATYTGTSPTVTDQLANVYTRLTTGQGGQLQDNTNTASFDAWVCIVTVAGTPTITYKANGATSEPFIALKGSHFTGSDASSTMRTSAGRILTNPGTTANAISASASALASQSGDLVWCGCDSANVFSPTAGTSFSASAQDATSLIDDEWLSATGTQLASWADSTNGGASVYAPIGIVITPAAGGASSPIYVPRSSLWHPGRHPRRFVGHNRTLTWLNPPSVNTYVYAGSGGLQSGGVAPVQVLFIPRSTGGLQSGGHAPLLFVAIPKASGGLQSGGVAPRSFLAIPKASGGLQSGGSAPRTFTAVLQPSGGLHSAGTAPMFAVLSHRPSGGLTASGTAPRLVILSVRPAGGLNASGAASTLFVPAGQPQQTRSTTLWIGMGIRV